MPRIAKELADKQVAKLAKMPGKHAVGGCRGLLLKVTPAGTASWVLRIKLKNGRRIDRGLGSIDEVGLKEARQVGNELRKQLWESPRVDPTIARKKALAEAAAADELKARAAMVTFGQDAEALHATKSQEFKNAKHAAQWINSMREYAKAIWDKPIIEISRDDVLAVLSPIWQTKTETATRVRQRMEAVLSYAAVIGHRAENAENPARWQGGLQLLLANPSKLKKGRSENHPALPWRQLPEFIADLRTRDAQGAKALEFAILTAARSSEVRLATWREVDLKAGVWKAPAAHMKSGLEHRVPLSKQALQLLKQQPKGKSDELLFPSGKGTPLSDNTLSKLIKDMHAADVARGGKGYLDPNLNRIATPHGTARSSFKDWCRETLGTKYQDEVSELALAHVSDDKTRAAYARNELLELRAALMQEWATFLATQQTAAA